MKQNVFSFDLCALLFPLVLTLTSQGLNYLINGRVSYSFRVLRNTMKKITEALKVLCNEDVSEPLLQT